MPLYLMVKWEVFFLIVDTGIGPYRELYHEIGNIDKCPFTYWLNGRGGFSKS